MIIVRYNHVNGVRTSENAYLLRDILQKRMISILQSDSVTRRNTGSSAGSEIAHWQLYVSWPFALSAIPSSAHIEGILKNILEGRRKPFRGATLRQICGIIME